MAIVHQAAAAVQAAGTAYSRKWTFLGVFVVVFLGSTMVLSTLDLLPNPPKLVEGKSDSPLVANSPASPVLSANAADAALFAKGAGELPTLVEIPTINLKVTVANPQTTNIEKLDAALLTGAVRYPTSAALGENGNVVIFAHSSYLPVVNNQAFKAFNSIQNLKKGDRITVHSAGRIYTYSVATVEKVNAEDAAIPLSVTGSKLTLATCDSFGTKSDRFVVTADLVESKALGA